MQYAFPVIDPAATGRNIVRLRQERGLTVRDLQTFFGFEEPQAIYKWQRGQSLPTVDNLYALGALLGVSMEEILVAAGSQQHKLNREQQADACCSSLLPSGCFGYGRGPGPRRPICAPPASARALRADRRFRTSFRSKLIVVTRRTSHL